MTKEEAAALFNGAEYPARAIERHQEALKAAGLIAAYGYSDDLLEFTGAIRDEVGAYEGTSVRVDRRGVIPTFDDANDQGDEDVMADYFARKGGGVAVTAVWAPDEPKASWLIGTDAPHATFDIMEEGDLYCRGIVFDLPA